MLSAMVGRYNVQNNRSGSALLSLGFGGSQSTVGKAKMIGNCPLRLASAQFDVNECKCPDQLALESSSFIMFAAVPALANRIQQWCHWQIPMR